MSILEEIFEHKKNELALRKQSEPEANLEKKLEYAPEVPDFQAALRNDDRPAPRLIAEVKHRSPSKGLLSKDFDPLRLAGIYARNGAAAVSVLTDEAFFGGSLQFLSDIAAAFLAGFGADSPPLLRKDFIFDRYQLLEARLAGASAVLLIAAMLEQGALELLIRQTKALGMAALVEVHNRNELDMAVGAGATVIGINNRNLHTFEVDLETTLGLLPYLPKHTTLVSESGIRTRKDADRLAEAGAHAILVGEGIVTAVDPAAVVRQLSGMEAGRHVG